MRLEGRALGAGIAYAVIVLLSFDTQMFPMPSMAMANGLAMPLVIVALMFCLPFLYIEMLPNPLLPWKLATQRFPDGSTATPVGRSMPAVIVACGCRTYALQWARDFSL